MPEQSGWFDRAARSDPPDPDSHGQCEIARSVGSVRLTWSLTPHSPAGELARLAGAARGPCPAVAAAVAPSPPRAHGGRRRRAGLTPKPHHAQQPRVALRGSFRLRLASTCNHRPARSPWQCRPVPSPRSSSTATAGSTTPPPCGGPARRPTSRSSPSPPSAGTSGRPGRRPPTWRRCSPAAGRAARPAGASAPPVRSDPCPPVAPGVGHPRRRRAGDAGIARSSPTPEAEQRARVPRPA